MDTKKIIMNIFLKLIPAMELIFWAMKRKCETIDLKVGVGKMKTKKI